jgi:hypothetical protein
LEKQYREAYMDEVFVEESILEELSKDEVLASYVKNFSLGDIDVSRILFPFVAVGNVDCEITPRTIGRGGSDVHRYTIEVVAGTKHTLPEIALRGDKKEKKGIKQLCDDVVRVIRMNTYGGLFNAPPSVVRVRKGPKSGSAGTIWGGVVTFDVERTVNRPV